MAEERLINEIQKDEFHQIMELINSNENFLLSGGAGSGKTYSLVQVIKQVLTSNPTVKVACITYTNAAVKEIEERVNHKNLNVSTIHDFFKDNNIMEDFSDKTFGEVVEFLQRGKSGKELKKVQPTPSMQQFIDANGDLYSYALNYDYSLLSKIHIDKDQLLDDKKQSDDDDKKKGSKRDNLIRHLFKIQRNIELYNDKQFNEFLRRTDYPPIRTISDKRTLKNNIETLTNVGDKTIEEVINDAHEMHICLIDEKLERFKLEKGYVYDRVKAIKYSEFQKLYEYLEGKTPFSTQHKTKGAEFE